MIESITIQDFQGHKKKTVVFDRVTTIVGPTDEGKSSILRALKASALNEWPRGAIRHGAKGLKLIVKVDGRKVVRVKSKRSNSLILDGKKFTAFGANKTPPEVAALFNLGQENFQGQMDAPFWFSKTPGQVSKDMNRVIALDQIDRTLAAVLTEVRKRANAVQFTKEQLADARIKVKSFQWVDKVQPAFWRAWKAWKSAKAAKARYADMAAGLDSLETALASRPTPPDFSRLQTARVEADDAAEARRELEALIQDYDRAARKEKDLAVRLERAKKAMKDKGVPCPVCGKLRAFKEKQ